VGAFVLGGAASAQSLFDDFGEPAWMGGVGYARGVGIEPEEADTVVGQLGFSHQGRLDAAVFAGQLSTRYVDFAFVGAAAEFFLRSSAAPFVPSLSAQVTRSSPNGNVGGNTTSVLLGAAGTLVVDFAENLRLLPRMSVGISKAFSDPNERGEYETIMIAEIGATLFMKVSDWKPTGVFFAPVYSVSDGDGAIGGTIGFSIGL